jgi:hypothetical protein
MIEMKSAPTYSARAVAKSPISPTEAGRAPHRISMIVLATFNRSGRMSAVGVQSVAAVGVVQMGGTLTALNVLPAYLRTARRGAREPRPKEGRVPAGRASDQNA